MRARLLAGLLCLGSLTACWKREAVWEATDAHRPSVARPGESEAERLYRLGHDCMEVIERDDCAIDYFEQLVKLEPDRRDLLGDATFRLVELYRRHDQAEDATLLLRKFWDLGMDLGSAGVVPYGTRFAPAGLSSMFLVDVAKLEASGLHARLPPEATDMMFTCDEARREELEAQVKARREAREAERLAAMSEEERAEYERRKRRRSSLGRRGRDQDQGPDEDERETVVGAGAFCKVAAALGLADPRDFQQFLAASKHDDPHESIAVLRVEGLEDKLAAAVEAGRIVAEPTPEIEGRDLSKMTQRTRDKLRVWTVVDFEYAGAPVQLLSLDLDELTVAPQALVSGLLHARAHEQTRLDPQLRQMIGQVPPDVAFMSVVTPAAMEDYLGEMGAMAKILPNPDGLLIAAVVYDYAGLFVRVPTEDSVKAWLVLALARKLLGNAEEEAAEDDARFIGNLDISQARDGKALLMTNILTKAAVLRMFLGY